MFSLEKTEKAQGIIIWKTTQDISVLNRYIEENNAELINQLNEKIKNIGIKIVKFSKMNLLSEFKSYLSLYPEFELAMKKSIAKEYNNPVYLVKYIWNNGMKEVFKSIDLEGEWE